MDKIKCDYCYRHNIDKTDEPQDGYIVEEDKHICGECWMIVQLCNKPQKELFELMLQNNPLYVQDSIS